MIRQFEAQELCDVALRKHKLWEQGWRTNFSKATTNIAQCDYTNKRIIISIPHLNARSEAELIETIKHEVAHALVGWGHGHDQVWHEMAIRIGCQNPKPCAASNLDAGRELTPAEVKPEKKLKQVENYCPICGAVAVEKNRTVKSGKIWLKLQCNHVITKDRIKNPLDGLENWTSNSGKKIYPYQVDGIKFVNSANGRCLIADEPGLGKTVQALGALKYHPEMLPCLWVCKSTLKLQALREAFDWCGSDFIGQIIMHGQQIILPGLNLYVISMDLLRRMPVEKLEEIPFKTIVADEIQHFKNPDSSRTAELRKLVGRADFFIPLSGTPWKNRGSEYFSVLNMLKPEMFPKLKWFKNQWIEYKTDPKTGKVYEAGIRNVELFRNKTKSFVIRRMRDDVLPDLPKIDRQVRLVMMDEEDTETYNKAEKKMAHALKKAIIDGESPKNIAAMLMNLKHITGLAKVGSVIDDVEEWLENVPEDYEKLTIFHHHIDVGDKLQKGDKSLDVPGIDDWLVEHGYNKSLRLYGGRTPEERDRVCQEFKDNPKNRVMIASTLASGEGLNLQFCQNAYQVERQWNPQNEEQAEMRFSRPLTKSDLPEYLWPIFDRKISIRLPYFIAADTVDDILNNIIERKRIAFRKSMNVGEENLVWDENSIVEEVARAIIKKQFQKR
jgi:SNF2 family DNA or RNA helicase